MKRMTKYVALDVHQATTVVSVREETGRVIARTIVPTEEVALVELVRGMRGAIHVVRRARTARFRSSQSDRQSTSGVHDAEAEDCSANPEPPHALILAASGADCPGQNRSAISEEEVRP